MRASSRLRIESMPSRAPSRSSTGKWRMWWPSMISSASCSGVLSVAESTGDVISSATGTVSGSRRLSASFFITSRSEKTPTTLFSPSTTATAPTPFFSIMRMESATDACRCTVAGCPSHMERMLIIRPPIMRSGWRKLKRLLGRADDGFGFDLDQHLGIDERAYLDHAGCGPDVFKELAVGAPDLLPVPADVDDVHARAHHIFHGSARFLECGFDVAQGLHGLGVGVAFTDDRAALASSRSSGDVDGVAELHRARVADDGLPGSTAGDVLSHM